MKNIAFALLTYVALVLQASVAPHISFEQAEPNFLMLVLVLALQVVDGWQAIVWAAVSGFLADCLMPEPLGTCMLTSTVAALLVQSSTIRRLRHSALTSVPLAFGTIFSVLLLSAAARLVLAGVHSTNFDPRFTLVSAAYTVTIGTAALAAWRILRAQVPSGGLFRPGAEAQENRWKILAER